MMVQTVVNLLYNVFLCLCVCGGGYLSITIIAALKDITFYLLLFN